MQPINQSSLILLLACGQQSLSHSGISTHFARLHSAPWHKPKLPFVYLFIFSNAATGDKKTGVSIHDTYIWIVSFSNCARLPPVNVFVKLRLQWECSGYLLQMYLCYEVSNLFYFAFQIGKLNNDKKEKSGNQKVRKIYSCSNPPTVTQKSIYLIFWNNLIVLIHRMWTSDMFSAWINTFLPL